MARIRPAIAAILVTGAALSACAYSYDPPATAALPPGVGTVAFDAPALGGDPGRRIRYVDMWQTEEYALFQGGGAQSEFVYATTHSGFEVVLEYGKTIEAAVAGFTHNRGDKAWDEARSTNTNVGLVWYRPYRLARTGQSCVGFTAEWHKNPNDQRYAPRRVLFGYHCQPKALSPDDADDLIRRVQVRGITVPMKPSDQAAEAQVPRPTAADQQVALDFARGGPGGEAGVPAFPHRFARSIWKSNGGNLM